MDDLLAARSQMAMSLAFHMSLPQSVLPMPLLMVIAEWRWMRTEEEVYIKLAKRWAKGTDILFAVGASLLFSLLLLLVPHLQRRNGF